MHYSICPNNTRERKVGKERSAIKDKQPKKNPQGAILVEMVQKERAKPEGSDKTSGRRGNRWAEKDMRRKARVRVHQRSAGILADCMGCAYSAGKGYRDRRSKSTIRQPSGGDEVTGALNAFLKDESRVNSRARKSKQH